MKKKLLMPVLLLCVMVLFGTQTSANTVYDTIKGYILKSGKPYQEKDYDYSIINAEGWEIGFAYVTRNEYISFYAIGPRSGGSIGFIMNNAGVPYTGFVNISCPIDEDEPDYASEMGFLELRQEPYSYSTSQSHAIKGVRECQRKYCNIVTKYGLNQIENLISNRFGYMLQDLDSCFFGGLGTASEADVAYWKSCVKQVSYDHKYQTITTPATQESDGSIRVACEYCHKVKSEETIPRLDSNDTNHQESGNPVMNSGNNAGQDQTQVQTPDQPQVQTPTMTQKETVQTQKLKVNKKSITLKKGKSFQLKVTRIPAGSTEKIVFKSLNKKVAKVSSKGKIKALRKGTAKIKIISGNKSKIVKVKVK